MLISPAVRVPPRQHAERPRRGAFTLIELLVVIAIIAILVSILLPSIKQARLEGWKTISLANARSIGQAGASYQSDQKGELPITPTGIPVPPEPQPIVAVCTWGGWGKYTSSWWQPGNYFDIAPVERPLNPYLYDSRLPARADAAAERKIFSLPGCKDPSDKIGHQQTWDAYLPTFGIADENSDRSSCYDDVGTSYLCQFKWFFQCAAIYGGNWRKAFRLGTERLRLADSFQPSRMIWLNDEYCDITINQRSADARILNGYGDINKAVVTFLDGHTRYMKMIPGGEGDPNRLTRPWLVPAFSNSEYTVVLPDLHP